MALGSKTIEIIKKEKLLERNKKMGRYILDRLNTINGISNQRGLGMMLAFDLPSSSIRDDFIIECVKNGLLVLGCGERSIRVIPPYVIEKREVDEGLNIIEKAVKTCSLKGFKHRGKICDFMACGRSIS